MQRNGGLKLKLEVKNISKKLNNRIILHNISLKLESGKIYGFVGRNGSGKTMLFRAISGLMKPDEGEISLDEKILYKDMEIMPNLGIIIENAGLFPEYSGKKNLEILAAINKKITSKEISEAIKRVGLDPYDKKPFKKYSLGMKQRLVIAQAIMEKPDIILLDEPTNAIDQKGVEDIRKLILEEKERGAIVAIASHNREDITILADKVFYMDEGKITEENDNE
ncbi:MAG: ATP-binding cassette domain-containing protein [Lachnospiraceae bacterium]|nr:ATP-binding cassette domain-containing protein [Lachnospiraceae bacterium]